jgi:CDP-diacylglycerol---serine O-phosphatidyltransferase
MKRTRKIKKDRSRRGIYILPNIFTSLNLFCGFYAVIAAIDSKFLAAAVAIIIGVMFDILDGKIARATNTTSKFGIEYDSLADLISFGLAPGVMIYLWALKPLGRIGWLAAFLFMACGALRLARFNSQAGTVSSDYFVGLPIPAGAGMSATAVLFCHRFGFSGKIHPILILVLLYLLSFLMVSTIKYNSFKKPELFKKMNFNVLVAVILVLIFIAAQPSIALFLLGIAYVISGPVAAIRHHKQAKNEEAETREIDDHSSNPV